MSQLKHIEDVKETDKTKISIVFYELKKASCILRICKKRDLTAVCMALQKIRNPNTVVVYDYVYANGDTYILEENVCGKTVEEIMEKSTFSEKETARIIIGVCNALKEVHAMQPPIVHNDINPSNIMIEEDGNVKLFDFDISRTYKKGNRQNTVLFGTEEYASPEHFGYGQSEPRTDIYCLGVTMHKMLSGKSLSAEHKMVYSGKLKNIIKKCLEFDPKDRYANVDALKKALEEHVHGGAFFRKAIALVLLAAALVSGAFLASRFVRTNAEEEPYESDVAEAAITTTANEYVLSTTTEDEPVIPVETTAAETTAVETTAVETTATETTAAETTTAETTAVETTAAETTEPVETTVPVETTTYVSDEPKPFAGGATKDTATQMQTNTTYNVSKEPIGERVTFEEWYSFSTVEDKRIVVLDFSFEDYAHMTTSKRVTVYNSKYDVVADKQSITEELSLSFVSESEENYWIKFWGNAPAPYSFSVEERQLDSGISREDAVSLELGTEYIKTIETDGINEWFKVMTTENDSIYRFYVDSQINENPVNGRTALALYNANGIKIKNFSVEYTKDGFIDVCLDKGQEIFIKISVENTTSAKGDYLLSVTEHICDAGWNKENAVLLDLSTPHSGVLDTTVSDWYAYTFDQDGKCILDFHNIDVGATVEISLSKPDGGTITSTTWVENEESGTKTFSVAAGDTVYVEIKSKDSAACGGYIINACYK